MRAFVIDTETGGLDPTTHSILSLAMVCLDLDKMKVESSIAIDVKEDPIIVTEKALQVNKINLHKHYGTAIIPSETVKIVRRYVDIYGKGTVVIGQNVSFDIGFMKRLFRLAGESYEDTFSYRSVDTASLLRYLYHSGMIKEDVSSLDKALKYFKIEIDEENRHTALGDALATAHLYLSLLKFIKK